MSKEQVFTIGVAMVVAGVQAGFNPHEAAVILSVAGVLVTGVGTLFVHSLAGQRLVGVVAHMLEGKVKQ